MVQYLLTALAGIVLGVVGVRVWQARDNAPTPNSPHETDAKPRSWQLGTPKLLLGAAVLAVVAAIVFAVRPNGSTTVSNDASSAMVTGSAGGQVADVDTMITRLADRLRQHPDDGEGFRMLGWSYVMTGRPDKAIEPYKRALALLPKSAAVHTGYGEALTGIAGGKVTDEAKREFDRALALDPAEPRARYFAALWQDQHGDRQGALDKWIALANSGAADAPWQADVREKIAATSVALGIDVSGRLKNASPATSVGAATEAPPLDPGAVQAASAMAPTDRQAMIDGMVEGLASRLKANPKDPDGWVRLLRSRMVLKQADQAGRDLASARKALAGDAPGLAKVEAAARELSVPRA